MSSSREKPPIELRASDNEVWLTVRLQPRASRNDIHIEPEGRVRIALTAAPVRDAANSALCAFLAKRLGVAKSDVRVVRGHKSRDKVVALHGVTVDTVRRFLHETGS